MFVEGELRELERTGLLRALRTVDGAQGVRVTIRDRQYLNFCSNDYLGLASDPTLKQAAINAAEKYGVGAGASRLVCGNLAIHDELERAIADFKSHQASIVFPQLILFIISSGCCGSGAQLS